MNAKLLIKSVSGERVEMVVITRVSVQYVTKSIHHFSTPPVPNTVLDADYSTYSMSIHGVSEEKFSDFELEINVPVTIRGTDIGDDPVAAKENFLKRISDAAGRLAPKQDLDPSRFGELDWNFKEAFQVADFE